MCFCSSLCEETGTLEVSVPREFNLDPFCEPAGD